MKPWVAGGVLAGTMCFTLTCYFFQIPDELRKKNGRSGRWGPPNAEFNWCEPDYELVDWMAEPVNTVSNLVFVILPAAFMAAHKARGDVVVMAVLIMAIGVGSILFHGSLRYTMQLADELPMFWYALVNVASILERLRGIHIARPLAAWAVLVSALTLLTEQHSLLHEAFRLLMSLSFAVAVIIMGWGSTAGTARIKAEAKRRHVPRIIERFHLVAFLMFVLALVCWLSDNYFCSALQKLPFGLPYPHLHMWWHLLTGGAVYSMLCFFHADDRRASEDFSIGVRFGILPVVLG